MIYSKRFFSSFEEGIDKQWLITNGVGGYASSTLIGCNTRKYHGLLVTPKKPPFERTYYVSKINETVIVNGKKYDISSNECLDYISKGYNYQTSFEKEYYPVYEYSVGNSTIKKSICMIYGEPTTIVKYEISTMNKDIKMEFSPLINYRDFHSTNNDIEKLSFAQIRLDDSNLKIIYDTENNLYINSNIKDYVKLNKTFFSNMHYRVEKNRGLDDLENHMIPGVYTFDIEKNSQKTIYFCFSTRVLEKINVDKVFDDEIERQRELVKKAGIFNDYANKLIVAADQFVIKKSNNDYGILAGYPWFDEWGRDKFIAFEGLLLVTKRFDIAKKILKDSIKDVKNGIMANTYNHLTGERLYNSVDAGLWYFEAINKYIKYTNDINFVKDELYETMKNIILSYNDGTDFSIAVDKQDGLLMCGNENIQLTWMDAKVGSKVITPRNGKCVEINALWYNALMIMTTLNELDSTIYMRLAHRCKESFNERFWNSNKYCLYDVIDPYSPEIRPNQILALSLSYPIVTDKSKSKDILDTVQEHLYTPYGLRTLSPYSKMYKGKYCGDVLQRDSSYHQGTVWPWLLSEYIISFCRVNKYSIKDRQKWIKYIEVLRENIVDDCIDNISEIFDGDRPHNPNGAFAQAWSVANILKLYSEVE